MEYEVKYAHKNSMYRFSQDEGTTRIEIRCNDVNISPWAVQVRLGSMAITLAIAQTSLAARLHKFTEQLEGPVAGMPQRFNTIMFNQDGVLQSSQALIQAVDFQTRQAELFLSGDMVSVAPEPPKELMDIASELYDYCEDMRKVIAGKAPFTILRDRTDWAAKYHLIMRRAARERKAGEVRALSDKTAVLDDLAYDYMQVKRDDNGTDMYQ